MDGKKVTPALLQRYLDGICTAEEINLVEQWYASVKVSQTGTMEFDQKKHFEKIQQKIQKEPGLLKQKRPAGRVHAVDTLWIRYAVAALVILVSGLGIYFFQTKYKFNKIVAVSKQTVITNSHKQVTKHFLPDGSIVWLNPAAIMTYSPETFSGQTREINISGEAFFDVAKDASRPFFVQTDKMLIKVLGTSFNVKATSGQGEYEVSVVTGRVQVSSQFEQKKTDVLLMPRQKAVFETGSGLLTASDILTTEKAETWQPVSLTFEDENLGEVVKRLEAKFGISIVLANGALNNCLLKATFENNRLSEILETTTQMLNATYEMNGDFIVISGKGCVNEDNN